MPSQHSKEKVQHYFRGSLKVDILLQINRKRVCINGILRLQKQAEASDSVYSKVEIPKENKKLKQKNLWGGTTRHQCSFLSM